MLALFPFAPLSAPLPKSRAISNSPLSFFCNTTHLFVTAAAVLLNAAGHDCKALLQLALLFFLVLELLRQLVNPLTDLVASVCGCESRRLQ